MTSAVIIIVTWIALGAAVVALLNLAKLAVRSRHAPRSASTEATPAWPAPSQAPAPNLQRSSFGGKRPAA